MKKFQEIFESNFSRFQGGGFLTGDLVRIKKEILESEWGRGIGTNYSEQLKRFLESDLNIRISSVKTLRPAVQGSVQQDIGASSQYFADVCLEDAPGRFVDFTEVPTEFLEHIDTGVNLSPIPDSQKRESDVNIKPKEITNEEEGDDFMDPTSSTGVKTGDKTLPSDNTTLPGAIAGTSYTAGYLG